MGPATPREVELSCELALSRECVVRFHSRRAHGGQAAGDREALEQRRLPGAVFTHEHSDLSVQLKRIEGRDRRHRERERRGAPRSSVLDS